ncbi:phage tail protein [candidate division LCP-89 bacterium B3_LCP]|uniref:Phage tail protein n=1 Tax=candidate division LCP-89 bacterium B3_LCP TaxID=2012998 RepID=A0A532UUA1_UNCL8|nr:MAG: phage tail protein [candidate division LCP-89 bacterium B3_LCP]
MPTTLFSVNTHRHDPYRTFKFQIIIDGNVVAGLKKMGALKKKTEPVKWRASNDPSHERIMPGGTSYEPVALEQGLTHDLVFEEWANKVNNIEGDAAVSLKDFRKDIVINVLNLSGQVAISYKLFRAWVSDFQALPDLDAGSMNTVGIQTITLQHEGWERDTGVSEPTEA